jgi:hypothetical protein
MNARSLFFRRLRRIFLSPAIRRLTHLFPCLAATVVITLWGATPPAVAGNLVITGHDSDFHAKKSSAASAQVSAMVSFARAAAPDPRLPVLVFDHGDQLQSVLRKLEVDFRNLDPSAGVPAADLFDVRKFSAIGVASDWTCIGDSRCCACDNDEKSSANLVAARSHIEEFFNKGGGIFAFSAARNAAYYNFLPHTVGAVGEPDPNGYEQTTAGRKLGVPTVNGDETQNVFAESGAADSPAALEVVERYTGIDRKTNASVSAVPATMAIEDG